MEITAAQVDDFRTQLRALPPLEANKQKLTLKEAIARMAEEIRGLRDKGYSWGDIAAILGRIGITISPQSLNSYLKPSHGKSTARRKRGSSGTGRGKKTPRQDTATGSNVLPAREAAKGTDLQQPREQLNGMEQNQQMGTSGEGQRHAADRRAMDAGASGGGDAAGDRSGDRSGDDIRDGGPSAKTNHEGEARATQVSGVGGTRESDPGSPGNSTTRDQPQPVIRSSGFAMRPDTPNI